MLAAIGDLVEDVIVWLRTPVWRASDTPAQVFRRRGGSAANVAVAAAMVEGRARFIGAVGDDRLGDHLLTELDTAGVDAAVTRTGHTGTIVAVVEASGERSFLTDRGASPDLDRADPSWLDDVTILHVPAYSFVGRIADASRDLAAEARHRGIAVSADASSVHVLDDIGWGWVDELAPRYLFCNHDEAARMGTLAGVEIVVVHNGAEPTVVGDVAVPPPTVDHVRDSTGAGDAFAAAFLLAHRDGAELEDAIVAGHELAARSLTQAGALAG